MRSDEASNFLCVQTFVLSDRALLDSAGPVAFF